MRLLIVCEWSAECSASSCPVVKFAPQPGKGRLIKEFASILPIEIEKSHLTKIGIRDRNYWSIFTRKSHLSVGVMNVACNWR